MDFDLRRLRFFVEVVNQGGFSQAAKAMFATQPTVSKAVKQLEQELGVALFDRAGYRNELTVAGRLVHQRAVSLLSAGQDLVSELEELQGLKRGSLKLGFPRVGTSAMFAPLFARFRRTYPAIDVQMSVHDTHALEEALRNGQVDLAVLIHPMSPGFDSQHVRTEPLTALLPRTHPLAGRPSVKLASLAAMPFILFEEGFALNDLILAACAKHKIKPNVVLRSGQVDFIFELVAAGAGVAFLPRLITERRPHKLVRCPLLDEPTCKWHTSLAWRQGGYLSPAARAWLAHARED